MRIPFGRRGQKKKPAAGQTAPAEPDPAPPPAPVGVTSGVGVNETWIRVFEKNERVEERERLTDAQISQHMKSEFPGLDAKLFDRVEIARSKYNRGGFHKKDKSGRVVRPKIHSRSHAPGDGAAGRSKPFGPKSEGLSKQDPVTKHHKEYKSHKK